MNLLAPAKGNQLRVIGRVIRKGRKLVVTLAEVFAEEADRRKQVALMTATMMVVEEGAGLRD